jgi:hypothetical protein
VGGEVYKSTSSFANWSALARFAILGRSTGDAIVKGTFNKNFILKNDTTMLYAEGGYKVVSPNIFQEHWYGNHFKWENSFKKQHEVLFKGVFAYPRYNATVGANYALLSNYMYNNTNAMPDQYNAEFSIFSSWINKYFDLGRFCWWN